MKALDKTSDVDKIFGKWLLLQSELPKTHVKNGESNHGTTLGITVNGKLKPFTPKDTFVLFAKSEISSSNNIHDEDEKTLTQYITYAMRCYIYGDNSAEISAKLNARFRTDYVLNSMLADGILINNIEPIEDTSEYYNGQRWERKDLTINMTIAYIFPKIEQSYEYQNLEELNIENI